MNSDRKNTLFAMARRSVSIRVHPCHLLMAVALSSLAACAQPAPPRDNFYRLDAVPQVGALDKAVLPGVVEVGRLDVDGVLSERGLAYQAADGALARYSYDLWSDAPATALQLALAETLRAAHVADTVVTPDLRVPPDWAVRGRLYRFEYLPDSAKVVVRMQFGGSVGARRHPGAARNLWRRAARAGQRPRGGGRRAEPRHRRHLRPFRS